VLPASPKTRVNVWLTPQTQKLKITPKAKWSAYRQAIRAVVDKYDPRPGVDVKTFSATAVPQDRTSTKTTAAPRSVSAVDLIHPDRTGHIKLGNLITTRMGTCE